jgi:multiple sugar transport system permease protein
MTDEIFRRALRNSFVFTGTAVVVKTVLGVCLALLLARKLRLKRLIRGAVLLPWVIPTALSTLGWWWMFDSLYSVINWTLLRLGLIHERLQWLGDPHLAMAAVITVNVWRGLPFFAITILAGLIAIDPQLYEAAESDGAGAWARFWHVTLPLLRPVLAVVVLFSTILTFADFNIVYVLTRGGPVNSTHLFATLAYQVGLQAGRIGEGSAIALFMFPILALIVYGQLHYARREL